MEASELARAIAESESSLASGSRLRVEATTRLKQVAAADGALERIARQAEGEGREAATAAEGTGGQGGGGLKVTKYN